MIGWVYHPGPRMPLTNEGKPFRIPEPKNGIVHMVTGILATGVVPNDRCANLVVNPLSIPFLEVFLALGVSAI